MKYVLLLLSGISLLFSSLVFAGPNENAGIRFDLDATTYGNQNDTTMATPGVGDYIRVDVYAINVHNLDIYEFEVNYNPSQLDFITATPTNPITYEQNILTTNGGTALGWMIDTTTPGVLSIAYTLTGADTLEAPEGEGLMADIVFQALDTIQGFLTFGDVHFYDSFGVMDIITNKGIAILFDYGSVDGTVTDSNTGEPIGGAIVSIENNSDTTEFDGTYLLEYIPVGIHDITCTAEGYFDTADAVEVLDGQTVTVDLALEPFPNGTLDGTVTDANNGEPIEGALITATSQGRVEYTGYTNADGYYVIDSLCVSEEVGNYTVTCDAGYSYILGEVTEVEIIVDSTTTIDFALNSTVTVDIPNGGEEWTVGETHQILWTAEDYLVINSDSVFYSIDNGTNWTFIASHPGNPQSCDWTIPNTLSEECLVKVIVYDGGDNSASDESDAVFTIQADTSPPTVEVVVPNGGENWGTFQWHTISWTADDNVGVSGDSVYYSINDGVDWTLIASHTGNPQSCSWPVPNTPSTQCLVKVKVIDTSNNYAEDISDDNFTIFYQELLIINGDFETGDFTGWTVTGPHSANVIQHQGSWCGHIHIDPGHPGWSHPPNYRWEMVSQSIFITEVADSLNFYMEVSGSSYHDGGSVWIMDADSIGNYTLLYQTGGGGGTGQSYPWEFHQVNIESWAGHSVTLYFAGHNRNGYPDHQCDIYFDNISVTPVVPDTIPPTVTVDIPDGGENWGTFQWHTISWTADDNVGVSGDSVYYSINDGVDWTLIASHTGNPQSCSWPVPNTPSTQCLVKVKVIDTSNNYAEDISDDNFTIFYQEFPIINGDFETGDFTDWTVTGPHSANVVQHQGSWCGHIHISPGNASGSGTPNDQWEMVSQSIFIPGVADSLNFYMEVSGSSYHDGGYVWIMDADSIGNYTLLYHTGGGGGTGQSYPWEFHQVNIESWAGHSVTLYFAGHNRNGYPDHQCDIYFDNISVTPTLLHPEIVVEPASFEVELPVDTTFTTTMTINNPGNGPLDFDINICNSRLTKSIDLTPVTTIIKEVTSDAIIDNFYSKFSQSPISESIVRVDEPRSTYRPAGDDTITNHQLSTINHQLSTINHQPSYRPAGEDTIHYDGENSGAAGLVYGGTYEGAIRLTPEELGPYDGWSLISVLFYHWESGMHSGQLKIYGAGTSSEPGALLTSEPYIVTGQTWLRTEFTEPVTIDATQDIWTSVEITHTPGQYPIGFDEGPAVQGKGDFVYDNDNGWAELYLLGLNYNWNIRAIVVPVYEWLSVTPNSGTVPVEQSLDINVQFDTYGLTPDSTYTTNILIHNNSADSLVTIPVTMHIGTIGVEDEETTSIPKVFALSQNYPNPLAPKTTISYTLPKPCKVSLKIYNIKGQKVKTLMNDVLPAGYHSVVWNGKDDNNESVSSGIYLYRITAGDFTDTKKCVILK